MSAVGLLATTTLVCTLDRWRTVWRRAFAAPPLGFDLVLRSAPHAAQLAGPAADSLPEQLADTLRQRGFRINVEEVGDSLYLRADRHRPAAAATLLTHLALLLLLLGVALSVIYGWQEKVTLAPNEIIPLQQTGHLALRNDGFTISRYPDGSVAAYRAEVTLFDEGRETVRSAIEVNRPLSYNRVGFYLRGYENADNGRRLTLLVSHDPGYGPVVAAGLLLLLGMTLTFNFPRAWIQARFGAEGRVELAGWAKRQAVDFEREFEQAAAALKPVPSQEGEAPDGAG